MYLKIYNLYRGTNTLYVYIILTNDNLNEIMYQLKTWNVNNMKLYVFIYSPIPTTISNSIQKSNIIIEYIKENLTYLLDVINIKNNYFFKHKKYNKTINSNLIETLYTQVNKPSLKYSDSHHFDNTKKTILLFNELVNFIHHSKPLTSNNLKNYCLYKNISVNKLGNFETNLMYKKNHQETLDKFKNLTNLTCKLIQKYEKVNYNLFLSYSIISIHTHFIKVPKPYIKMHSLQNVYYYKKSFYDKNGNILHNDALVKDFEYKEFINKPNFDNDNMLSSKVNIDKTSKSNIIKIEDENTLYLDYIYNFYNFGEFWDVVHRLLEIPNPSKYQLFHLKKNRITNINYFFTKLGFKFPNINNNCITYHQNNNIYFFKKIYFLNIYNICRGWMDNFFAFQFNITYNNVQPSNDKKYCLYLKRGKFGRELLNENILIEKLNTICKNFIVIDGSEEYSTMVYYWTNAVLVIGAHGSLLKNMIYCKKNPIFIELTPDRHPCFYGNAKNCNFEYFYINVNKDDKENILLNTNDLQKIVQLVECIAPS